MNPSSSHRAYSVVCLVFLLLPMMGLSYVADSLHHAPSADIEALRAYLSAGGVELPESDEALKTLDSDGDGRDDFAEWVMGTDPLVGEPSVETSVSAPTDASEGMQLTLRLPEWFGAYAEIYHRDDLLSEEWQIAHGWLPTLGAAELTWQDIVRPDAPQHFYAVFDATLDLDGDGFSDYREHYITGTDPTTFDSYNEDGDWMHDWYEIKLFGNLDQDGSMDFDGDGLINAEEISWLGDELIVLYSDPTLIDSDGDGLADPVEIEWQTDRFNPDTDGDGHSDFFEVIRLHTDPHNPDITAPTFTLVVHNI